jgi:hypothetical protein
MVEIAYVAGIIDGEGTLSITGKETLSRRGTLYWNYDLEVTVTNTSVKLMEWLVTKFGGEIMPRSKPLKKTHKQCYRWRLRDNAARIAFLRAVQPFLVIKQRQADLLLEYLLLPRISPRRRYEIFQEVSALNA